MTRSRLAKPGSRAWLLTNTPPGKAVLFEAKGGRGSRLLQVLKRDASRFGLRTRMEVLYALAPRSVEVTAIVRVIVLPNEE